MAIENNNISIYLYHGDDDFSMAEEMKREKELFKKRSDEMNIITIDWKDQSISQGEKISKFQEALMGSSLFSSDKLVIIKNSLFSTSKKKSKEITESEENIKDAVSDLILKYFGNIQAGIKLFFLEENLDKRKKAYKELLKMEKSGVATIKEFAMPLNFQFDNWIKNRVEKQKGKITREAVSALAISLGKGFAQKD
ncbi:MAG: hypothetical protein KAS01_00615, partial [Candidatus Pacebacteria bacterium]|nr:hypothetical protein [Candidatus Paceibacterota bacterium]